MAKEEKEVKEKGDKLKVVKPSVDFPVDVVATEADPYHETNATFQAGCKKAIELEKRGWVTLTEGAKERIKELKDLKLLSIVLLLALSLFVAPQVKAQTSVYTDLKNTTYTTFTTDTVTNGGTGSLTSPRVAGGGSSVTLFAILTEISGTTAGTLTVLGSLDGTNYKAIPTTETQTAMATATATDVASQTFTWHLRSNPYTYYRLQWVGAGTMSATMACKILKH